MALTKGNIALAIALVILGMHACLSTSISKLDFPNGFFFGTASSSYQYEGAAREGGRGQSIWDTFSHTRGKTADGGTGDVTVEQYYLYEDDIQLMKDIGMDAYRFSIAWPRIFPNGNDTTPNRAGIEYYNNLIDALLAKGITPYVTLYHWDLPQALYDRYSGWLDQQILRDFERYAETCFKEFGRKVRNWITFNEPHIFTVFGYDTGRHAPGRTSSACTNEPYIVGHNVLLAHARVAYIYKNFYQKTQGGRIGIALDHIWKVAASTRPADVAAAKIAQDFELGWFLHPLVYGDYPESMRSRVGWRLPRFTNYEATLLKASYDFIGINHYTSNYASAITAPRASNSVEEDSGVFVSPYLNGKPIGEKTSAPWLFIVPEGMRNLLNYIRLNYENPNVIITENGMDDGNDAPYKSIADARKDDKRVKYYNGYLTNLLAAIKDGCNVTGYFAWSLLDNFEWANGYTARFGMVYVDFDTRERYLKDSANWFKNFLSLNLVEGEKNNATNLHGGTIKRHQIASA